MFDEEEGFDVTQEQEVEDSGFPDEGDLIEESPPGLKEEDYATF